MCAGMMERADNIPEAQRWRSVSFTGFCFFHWDNETIDHLEQHGVTQDEFAEVVENPDERGTGRSTGRPTATGAHQRVRRCSVSTK